MKKEKKKHQKLRKWLRRLVSLISLLGFLACSVALLYPVISDRWNRYRDMQLIADYNKAVAETNEDDYNDIVKKAEDYNSYLLMSNRNIVTDAAYDPDAYYETLLNITGNGMMCYVEIPKIDVTEPVYHYSTDVSLGIGVGHIHGSSLPTGGESTHTVLTGHRGLPSQKFFSDLDKLKPGDRFYIHVMGKTLAYQIFERRIIDPTDVSGLMIEDGKDLATLVTCEPYGVNTHRLVVTGRRIPFDDSNVENGLVTTEKHETIIDPAVWVFVGFLLFVLIMILFVVIPNVTALIKRKKHPPVTKEPETDSSETTGETDSAGNQTEALSPENEETSHESPDFDSSEKRNV